MFMVKVSYPLTMSTPREEIRKYDDEIIALVGRSTHGRFLFDDTRRRWRVLCWLIKNFSETQVIKWLIADFDIELDVHIHEAVHEEVKHWQE